MKTRLMVATKFSRDNKDLKLVPFKKFVMTPDDDKNCLPFNEKDLISEPHSNAFLDLNGDCMPDIFMTRARPDGSKYFEVYAQRLYKGKQRFCLIQTNMPLVKNDPKAIPLLQFTDLDRDGMLDFVFYHNRAIYVFYNMLTAKRFDTASI